MKISLHLITAALCAASSLAASHEQLWSKSDELIVDQLQSKLLEGTDASCNFGGVLFFNVETAIIPGSKDLTCSIKEQVEIGLKINEALLAVGIGDQKVDSSSGDYTMVGAVCPKPEATENDIMPVGPAPSVDAFKADGGRRRLNPHGYIWTGGGVSAYYLMTP